jgi:outer membrane protein W
MQKWCFPPKGLIILLLSISFAGPAFAKKDFKGLFGSYQREKYTENEGDASDFGIDLMLSTLIPVSPVVSTNDGSGLSNMYYSTFFNVEGQIFLTLNYNFEIFANTGYYSYDTRKTRNSLVSSSSSTANVLYDNFSMTSVPAILGIKYRFGRSDIVPYIGIGGGVSFVKTRAFYDYSNLEDDENYTVLTAEVIVGLEFFFSSRAGIRLETSCYYMGLPGGTYNPGGSQGQAFNSLFQYSSSPISVRYASGLFFLF